MLPQELLEELNVQIKHEFASANYYLAMAAYFAEMGLDGFTNFFIVQAEEERFHAMKFFQFINDLGGRVQITGFEDPKNDFSSVTEVFQLALEHEQFVSRRIHGLVDLAKGENHHPTISFLQWFVDEQVEEEATMQGILDKLKIAGESGPGLLHLDSALASRTFTPPPGA